MNLAETQRLFWELLQDHERPLDAFTGSPDLPAGERVAIYTSMVLHRQVDALRETFPRVVAVLGDDAAFFHINMCQHHAITGNQTAIQQIRYLLFRHIIPFVQSCFGFFHCALL